MTGMDVKPEIKLTALSRLIIKKDLHAQYKKIYLDSGGLGVGVLHTLMEDRQTKWKTMGINNASVLDEHKWVKGREAGKKSRLMKEELYINLKILMENGLLYLQKSDELFQSLVNIQAEDVNGELRIWGRESHITEALIRMAWSIRDKTLNSYIS